MLSLSPGASVPSSALGGSDFCLLWGRAFRSCCHTPDALCPLPPIFVSLPPEPYGVPSLAFQGWTYAIDFPATYTRDKKWNSCVRRRKWIRYRRYKSRDAWAKVCVYGDAAPALRSGL